ncbi:MAG: hypothetical protein CMJ64_29665 [Planctomycetaceae bacterium]|nr:hypothetical protein [Planctomycetaceae bacterium]
MRIILAWFPVIFWWIGFVAAAGEPARAEHWAYQIPRRPSLPRIDRLEWTRNAIDCFTLARMEQEELSPSDEATRRTLIRRVTLDITGLPPTPEEVRAFEQDSLRNPQSAFHNLVNRLLASPRFGERMASMWLDLARYADTHGYHMDAHRDMWRWRDWVIDAYNSNIPFDQFTVEQLAGDLLPNATLSQHIATGFNRNNMINFENGIIAEEFRSEYVVDRVVTTSTVWLGQTMLCARCHDHKYDPFTQRAFYRLYAFFNNVPENGIDGDKGNAAPFIKAPTSHQLAQLAALNRQLTSVEKAMEARAASVSDDLLTWASKDQAADTRELTSTPVLHDSLDDAPRDSSTFQAKVEARTSLIFNRQSTIDLGDAARFGTDDEFTISFWLFPTTNDRMLVLGRGNIELANRGYGLELTGGRLRMRLVGDDGSGVEIEAERSLKLRKWQHVAVRYDGSSKASGINLFVDGEAAATRSLRDDLRGSIAVDEALRIGDPNRENSFRGMLDELRIYDTKLGADEIAVLAGGDPIRTLLAKPVEQRTGDEGQRLRRYYLDHVDAAYRRLRSQRDDLNKQLAHVESTVPTTMVMQELSEPRVTRILERGRYDSLGEQVMPGVPEALPRLVGDAKPSRLALARWLVRPDHPLTSRVAVNHLWQQFFGTGIVRTPEDFGSRGEPPTHPRLLDWLATEFARDWDVKRIIKLMVTSATYRQSSRVDAECLSRDPENRWLSRASRFQLPAEMIRDNALATSGLLVERTGGPSVFPYQPAGLWEEISYNPNDFTAQVFRQSHGEDLYRRSLYTFWKRSVPSPTLSAFDAQSREVCVTTRPRTNTVQQVLVLMNDVTFVEASRCLAERIMSEADENDERLELIFQLAAGRKPTVRELQVLTRLLAEMLDEYRNDPELAKQLTTAGASTADAPIDVQRLAAWTAVASTVLSLDEVISRN